MGVKTVYESYAAAFEDAVTTDNWSDIGKYFIWDASYIDSMGVESSGRDAIVSYLQKSVEGLDKKFRSRELTIFELCSDKEEIRGSDRYSKASALVAIIGRE